MDVVKKTQYLFLSLTAVILLDNNSKVAAQITPDRTLGTEQSQVKRTGQKRQEITGGARRGNNLFHSFQDFNIKQGEAAYFIPQGNITNIFTRVTGKNASNIDGTLGVRGKANLFLLNPRGIIFGNYAKLELKGSFIATTGDSFIFSDKSIYSASDPQAPSLLTVNVSQPIGIRFKGKSGDLVYKGQDLTVRPVTAALTVAEGKTLGLIGGNISIAQGGLSAEIGNIEIGSVVGNNTVKLTPSGQGWNVSYGEVKDFGNVDISGGTIIGPGEQKGGTIQIYGKNITLRDGVDIKSINTGATKGGDINLIASDSIKMTNEASITSQIEGRGDGGNITLKAANLVELGEQSDSKITSVASYVQPKSAGKGGTITIETTKLRLISGKDGESQVRGTNSSQVGGTGPDIVIKAKEEITLRGGNSSIYNTVDLLGTSKGGSIVIETKKLEVLSGSEIKSDTLGFGDAGDLSIKAKDVEVIGGEISSESAPENLLGKGGSVEINTSRLLLDQTGQISTSTFGPGDGGDLNIKATDLVKLSGKSGIGSQVDKFAQGNGGNLTIETRNLIVQDRSQISTSTFGFGDGGDLNIKATDLVKLSGKNEIGSQVDKFAQGNGGNLTIETRNLIVQDRSQISTSTFGFGDGGTITIKVSDSVILTGAVSNRDGNSGISSTIEDTATGRAAGIIIETQKLQILQGAQILTDTRGVGNAGDIKITAKEMEIEGFVPKDPKTLSGLFAKVAAETGKGDGGQIIVNTGNLTLKDSGTISVESLGQGPAGIINLKADTIVLSHGFISGDTSSINGDKGGFIQINTKDGLLLRNGSEISTSAGNETSSGDGGNITITTPLLVAFPNENNHIKSNGFAGNGGFITVNADSVLGIYERDRPYPDSLSDFTAFSQQALPGIVAVNTLNLNPNLIVPVQPQIGQNLKFGRLCESKNGKGTIFFGYLGRAGYAAEPTNMFYDYIDATPWLELKSTKDIDNQSFFDEGLLKSKAVSFSFACGF